jgi:hypothetical protein
MRNALLLSLSVAFSVSLAAQAPQPATPAAPATAKPQTATPAAPATAKPQTAPPAAPATATPKPAAPPAQRRAATPPPSTRSGMAITVTNPQGGTLGGITVDLMGVTSRSGVTNSSGQMTFPGLQAGMYRLRFSGEEVITLERDVTLRGGEIADVDVTLSAAPPPKEIPVPVAPPPAPAPVAGPAGQPLTLSVPDVLEKDYIGKQPRRDSLLACSGNMRTTMIQVNETLPERLYDSADAAYYVIGGEGTLRLNGKDAKLGVNGFASVPRGVTHSFQRRGNRPLILLAILSGAPCEEAR